MEVNRYHLKSPIEIITTQLGIPQDYKQQCIDEIYKIGDQQNQQTNVKAIMSSWYIWEETNILEPLLHKVTSSINKLIPTSPDIKQSLINCWSAIYKKGHHTIPHHHVPYDISFVYYLKSNSKSSLLAFDKCNFEIQPYDDLLIIFPSYVTHSVKTQLDEEDRICIAGNISLDLKE